MEVKKKSPEIFGALFPSGNGPLGEKLQYVDLHFNGHYLWSTCDVLIHGWLNRIELAPRIVRTFWDSFSQWRCGIFISPKGCLMQWIRHYSERYWSCQMICWKNWSGVLIWNKTVPFLPVKSSTGIKYPAKTIIFGYCPILLKIISQTNKYLYYDLQLGSYINLDTEHHPKFLSQFYRLIRPGPPQWSRRGVLGKKNVNWFCTSMGQFRPILMWKIWYKVPLVHFVHFMGVWKWRFFTFTM